ncbi:MAG: hypothetical protein Homavirus2_11 [Homavirus sp.]|uniref:Uncharacterized protein n=1 Tax=Homavirus sp. TaxID=2487769 RepID=A0A3G5A466_9VIRU|nr:MAG: hypothetical protein Homavirus2_11 [Homavirus sp.]
MKINNTSEIIRRSMKYLVMLFVLALSLKYIPSTSLENKEIIILSTIGVITFAILDIYCPSVSNMEHLINDY